MQGDVALVDLAVGRVLRKDLTTAQILREAGTAGQVVSEGRVVDTPGVDVTPGGAAPAYGIVGSIDETETPNAESQVEPTGVSSVNPEC